MLPFIRKTKNNEISKRSVAIVHRNGPFDRLYDLNQDLHANLTRTSRMSYLKLLHISQKRLVLLVRFFPFNPPPSELG